MSLYCHITPFASAYIVGTTSVGALTMYAEAKPTALNLDSNSVAENSVSGASVGAFSSRDSDPNATFSYILVSGSGRDDNASFTIVGNTLKTTASFDYETKNSYSIRVHTTDRGGLFTEQSFTINVNNVHESPTGFINATDGPSSDGNTATFDVNENVANGTTLATLAPANPDSGNSYTYALVTGNGDSDNASFAIVGNALKTTSALDYETKRSYTARVRITDSQGQFAERSLTIAVNDINETPTALTLSNSQVNENQPVSTTVGIFQTTDQDTNESFTYTLVNGAGSADNASFAIVNNTLKTMATFDYETKPSYTIRVRTTDHGGLYIEQSFTINVNDVNEAPTALTLSSNQVDENQPISTTVGLLHTADPDHGDTFTYMLVDAENNPDNANFVIISDTLKTTAVFDYETKTSYAIRVRTTDRDGLYVEQSFTINVNNLHEPPTSIINNGDGPDSDGDKATFDVKENVANGTMIAALAPNNVDFGNSYTYTLVSGNGDADNASFTLVGNTLKTNNPLDYEAKNSYTIRVRITDRYGSFVEQSLTIQLDDVPEPAVARDDNFDPRTSIFLGGQTTPLDVLANDVVNALGKTLSVVNLTQPAAGKGSVVNNANNVSYAAPASGNSSASFTYQASNGLAGVGNSNSATVSLSYVANDLRGDCNGNGSVTAADFIATVLEIFDLHNTAAGDGKPGWWLAYTGDYAGSPRGCDSNASQNGSDNSKASVTAADIICTVLIFFNHKCGAPVQAVAAQPAQLTVLADPANATTWNVNLSSGGNAVAAAAFALDLGNASFDATDANTDGLPDAVTLNLPASMSKAVVWDAQAHRLTVAIFGASLPLPTLNDAVLATVKVNGGNSKPTLTLVSLSDPNGSDLPSNQPDVTTNKGIFLPLVIR